MKRNAGNADRVIRGVLGIAAGVFGVLNIGTWWGIVLLIVGIVFVFTALFGWCPIYALFKLSTYKKKA